jgi:glutamate-1-semialdehyde 2,1-aminomutase
MRAGIETLRLLREPGAHARLEETSAALEEGLLDAARSAGVAARVNRVGSMMTVFFTAGEVVDFASAARCDTARYAAFFTAMLERGVYLPPSQFEAFFVSLAHGPAEVRMTVAAAREAFASLSASG